MPSSEMRRFQNAKPFYSENMQVKCFDIFKIKYFIKQMVEWNILRNKPFCM